jgi:hypothetical protein
MKIKLSQIAEACFKFDQSSGRFSLGTQYKNLSDNTKHDYEGEALRIIEILKSLNIKSAHEVIKAAQEYHERYKSVLFNMRSLNPVIPNLLKAVDKYNKSIMEG